MAETKNELEFIKGFLSDLEIGQLERLAEDSILLEAIKKVILFGLYNNGVLASGKPSDPLRNFALQTAGRRDFSNEQLGATIRASAEGMALLENGIKLLEKFKVEKSVSKDDSNPAR